jgi:hypothetical protein
MPRLVFPSDRHESFADSDGIESVAKDEDSVRSYTLDWTIDKRGNEMADSDTISTSAWECNGVAEESSSNTTTTTTIQVSGTNGTAKNTVVTAGGETLIHRIRFVGVKA